jgi:hypothetical protein
LFDDFVFFIDFVSSRFHDLFHLISFCISLLGQVPGLQHSGDDKLSIEEYEKLVRKAMPGTVK